KAAIEALAPAAAAATTAAAKYAVTKGPTLVRKQVTSRVMEAGGAKGLLDKAGGTKAVTSLVSGVSGKGGEGGGLGGALKAVGAVGTLASRLKPGGGGGEGATPDGTGRGRRLPIMDFVEVAVPIEKVYNQWTQFEEFPKFMHRVERIEQRDETHLMWHENIWGVRRQWEAEITEQKPEERIVWKSTGGPKQLGVVNFAPLAHNLTRVQVDLDFQPQGLFEKTASGTRITRRALKSDLMRFKAFMEMNYDETGAWRGVVEEGEVKEAEDEEAQGQRDEEEEEYDEDEGPEGHRDEESDEYDEAEEEEEEEEEEDEGPEGQRDEESDEDEDYEEEEEEEEEPPPPPPAKRATAKKAPAKKAPAKKAPAKKAPAKKAAAKRQPPADEPARRQPARKRAAPR
ncbi:MAG: SRPBCC family protein, partial [Myxococcaceae bacterium]